MELVEGRTLRELLARSGARCRSSRRSTIADAVLAALGAAHARGVWSIAT